MSQDGTVDLAAIRSLLQAAFTADDLRRFCQDRPAFRFILDHFGPSFSFMQMIDVVLDLCQVRVLLRELLDAVRAENPRQYERIMGMGARRRVVNLRPLDMTHAFQDRKAEIRTLREHLADARVRLISVVGRGGMGKTALVSHVLAGLERGKLPAPGGDEELEIDGILYLSARSTGLDLDRIQADVCRMLGEPMAGQLAARLAHGDASPAARVENLLEALQSGLYLIVLDNLEDCLDVEGHVLDEGFRLFLEQCLTRPSGARLIATSREQMAVPGEARYAVRVIPLGEGLPAGEAAALLHELDPQGQLGLKEASQLELEQAARRTAGIPRALELLAGILDQDPASSLGQLLADERLFGTEVVERLVEEGYRRLGHDERRVMEALAVFDRPVREDAVVYLLQPWLPSLQVRTALFHLVRGYLVTANRASGEYSLHALDRQHAYGELPDNDEPQAYNRRHLELRAADYYADHRRPTSEWHSIGDLAPQLAEFEHRVRAGDFAGACMVLEPIDHDCLYLWGHYSRLLDMRQRLAGQLKEPGLQADNLGGLGRAHRGLGQFDRAMVCFQQALEIARQAGDRAREGIQVGHLGGVYRAVGRAAESTTCYEQALAIAREIGDRRTETLQLGHLGMSYRALGQIGQGLELHRQALAIAREIQDLPLQATNLASLGSSYRAMGQIEQARELFAQALSLAQQLGDRRVEGFCLASLGRAHRDLGQPDKAIDYYEQALAIARETGYRQGEAADLGDIGDAYSRLDQIERAVQYHQQALGIARDTGDRYQQSQELLRLGRLLLAAGNLSQAEIWLAEALAANIPATGYEAALLLGVLQLVRHDPTPETVLADAMDRCRQMLRNTPGLYRARYVLAIALAASAACQPEWSDEANRGRLLAPALDEYRRALDTCAAPGVLQDTLHALELVHSAGIEGLEPIFEVLQSHPGSARG